MRSMVAAALFIVLAAAGAGAQTSSTSPEAEPAPSPGAAGAANKELIANCRMEVKSEGAKGPAMRAAVNACVAKTNPMLAKRMDCRAQAKAQGIADEDQVKAYVKSCLSH